MLEVNTATPMDTSRYVRERMVFLLRNPGPRKLHGIKRRIRNYYNRPSQKILRRNQAGVAGGGIRSGRA